MSRSPYFKVNPRTNVKGGPLNGEGYTYTTSSHWAPRSAMLSGGQQVLKRGSSVIDGDFGSVAPIRRIRQKYNSSSPRRETHSSLSGAPLSSPLALTFKEIEGSTSAQKSLLSGQPMHRTAGSQVAGNGISNASIASIQTRSSETAHKLFQQLDRLLPSPKERASDGKTIARDESPSNLTLHMLHGRARGSMEDVDSSKISSTEGSGKLGTTSDSHLPTGGSFFYGKMDTVEENGHPKSRKLGVELTSETNEVKNASVPSTSNTGRIFSNAVASTSVALVQSENTSFQMSASEHLSPTMPTTLPNQPTLEKEHTSVFNFGSKAPTKLAFSSTLMGDGDSAGVKLDTGSGSDLKTSNRV